jgi:hypothetical protein
MGRYVNLVSYSLGSGEFFLRETIATFFPSFLCFAESRVRRLEPTPAPKPAPSRRQTSNKASVATTTDRVPSSLSGFTLGDVPPSSSSSNNATRASHHPYRVSISSSARNQRLMPVDQQVVWGRLYAMLNNAPDFVAARRRRVLPNPTHGASPRTLSLSPPPLGDSIWGRGEEERDNDDDNDDGDGDEMLDFPSRMDFDSLNTFHDAQPPLAHPSTVLRRRGHGYSHQRSYDVGFHVHYALGEDSDSAGEQGGEEGGGEGEQDRPQQQRDPDAELAALRTRARNEEFRRRILDYRQRRQQREQQAAAAAAAIRADPEVGAESAVRLAGASLGATTPSGSV